jgi:hypothetical protein
VPYYGGVCLVYANVVAVDGRALLSHPLPAFHVTMHLLPPSALTISGLVGWSTHSYTSSILSSWYIDPIAAEFMQYVRIGFGTHPSVGSLSVRVLS